MQSIFMQSMSESNKIVPLILNTDSMLACQYWHLAQNHTAPQYSLKDSLACHNQHICNYRFFQ